jgi:hypothetical protein
LCAASEQTYRHHENQKQSKQAFCAFHDQSVSFLIFSPLYAVHLVDLAEFLRYTFKSELLLKVYHFKKYIINKTVRQV